MMGWITLADGQVNEPLMLWVILFGPIIVLPEYLIDVRAVYAAQNLGRSVFKLQLRIDFRNGHFKVIFIKIFLFFL